MNKKIPSPFPGMNPYLEQDTVWHDFHLRLCPAISEALVPQVRPKYFVKMEEHLYVHELPDDVAVFLGRSDVSVTDSPERGTGTMGTISTIAPTYGTIHPQVDLERESFIEIRNRETRRLVTVIEVLSPSNKKRGADRDQYIAKRMQYLHSTTHFVELDLLRGWPRMPVKGLGKCDYCLLVSRYEERPRVALWPLGLRDRLPAIPIPLQAPDPDAMLDLAATVNHIYDSAGYADYIYGGSPQPSLSADDAAWSREILAAI
jgi:hypothetical protein